MTIKKSYLSQQYQLINFFSILILSSRKHARNTKIIHIQIQLDELYLMIYKTKKFFLCYTFAFGAPYIKKHYLAFFLKSSFSTMWARIS